MGLLSVEAIPGGFTVTDTGDSSRWWSVAFRGSTPSIASDRCEKIDPHSGVGRHILAAIRDRLVAQ